MNLTPFMTQTWLKGKESRQQFHDDVNEHVKRLLEKGYNVEAEWLNSDGDLCQNNEELQAATTCRIVQKQPEKTTDVADWLTQQYEALENFNNNNQHRR